jgi:hypothetical protein
MSSERYSYGEELELGNLVLERRTKILGARHGQTLESMSTLLRTYLAMDQWQDAERLGREVVRLSKETLGSKHPVTLSCLQSLIEACTDSRQGEKKLREAQEWAAQLVSARLSVSGPSYLQTMFATEILALICLLLLEFGMAEDLFDATFQVRQTIQGEQHVDTLNTMNRLGRVYFAQGGFAKAEGLMSRILDIHIKTRKWEDPIPTSIMTHNLARTYYAQGHFSKSISLLEECNRMLRAFHPERWPIVRHMEDMLKDWTGEVSNTCGSEGEPPQSGGLETGRRLCKYILEIEREGAREVIR